MSFTPNIEMARARFVERVANAYFQTWAAYGFMGEEYSFERATTLAEGIAEASFPAVAPFTLDETMIDPVWAAEEMLKSIDSIYPVPANAQITWAADPFEAIAPEPKIEIAGHELPLKRVQGEYRYMRRTPLPKFPQIAVEYDCGDGVTGD